MDYVQRGTANIRQFNLPFVPTTTRDAEAPFYFGGIQTEPRFASGTTQDFAHEAAIIAIIDGSHRGEMERNRNILIQF